jgi:hypothetical protein
MIGAAMLMLVLVLVLMLMLSSSLRLLCTALPRTVVAAKRETRALFQAGRRAGSTEGVAVGLTSARCNPPSLPANVQTAGTPRNSQPAYVR